MREFFENLYILSQEAHDNIAMSGHLTTPKAGISSPLLVNELNRAASRSLPPKQPPPGQMRLYEDGGSHWSSPDLGESEEEETWSVALSTLHYTPLRPFP